MRAPVLLSHFAILLLKDFRVQLRRWPSTLLRVALPTLVLTIFWLLTTNSIALETHVDPNDAHAALQKSVCFTAGPCWTAALTLDLNQTAAVRVRFFFVSCAFACSPARSLARSPDHCFRWRSCLPSASRRR